MATTSTSDQARIEKLAHFKLPSGATDVHSHEERGMDAAIWLRFRIPATERSAFLRGAGYPDPLPASEHRYVRNDQLPAEPWWRPDELVQVESAHLLKEDGKPRYGSNLLLATVDSSITVYAFVTGL